MQKQWGGEGGPGLLAHLDGLLHAGPDQDHHGRHHQQLAGPAEEVDLMPGAEYNCKFRIFFNDQLFNLCILDEYTFVSFVFVIHNFQVFANILIKRTLIQLTSAV